MASSAPELRGTQVYRRALVRPVVVTLQMVGDLLVLGVLLQAIIGAAKLGRARRRNAPAE